MPKLRGTVVELGGRRKYCYKHLATGADCYVITNIEDNRDNYDEYADIMSLPYLDSSIDNFVAVALLEHIRDPKLGLDEVQRCLRPGGFVLLVVPVMFPHNPAPEEFFRFTEQGLRSLLPQCDVVNCVHLGGLWTLNSLAFQRSYLRLVGAWLYLCDILFGSRSEGDFPVLLCILARKR